LSVWERVVLHCWFPASTRFHIEHVQTISVCYNPSFFQQTAPIACSFCEGCTWHHLHILVKAPFCCDWKGRAARAQSFTPSHQATIKILRRAYLISACSRHMGVVLHAHPVRGESHIHHNANWEARALVARLG